jgi:NADPH:quinone reductase-like Zn-dependent oxidoreductase
MKAAVVRAPRSNPVHRDFDEPIAQSGQTLVTVSASALSQLTKSRASGSNYNSHGQFPAIAGINGVGRTTEGQRVYFVLPEAPFGALAEVSLVKMQYCIPLPDVLDDITAAAIANPGMSAWACNLISRTSPPPCRLPPAVPDCRRSVGVRWLSQRKLRECVRHTDPKLSL